MVWLAFSLRRRSHLALSQREWVVRFPAEGEVIAQAVWPPSIGMAMPLMKLASSLAR